MKFHLDKVQDLLGFATENIEKGDTGEFLSHALLTSDLPEFYQYSEQISNIFLTKVQIPVDKVYQFLLVIHQDLCADLYVNDFPITMQVMAKKDVKAGQVAMLNDIADIRKVDFPGMEFKDTDKVIYCFKVGWRFGLFFNLIPRSQPDGETQVIKTEKLNIEEMKFSIGALRRYLMFYHVYKVLESGAHFEEMMKNGWFPFIEILAGEYKNLSEVYQNKFEFKNRIKTIIDRFTEIRIKKITDKWWGKQIFADKKPLIEAGIKAYLQNNQDGFVGCIKILCSEIEGVLRKIYYTETGKGDHVKTGDFIFHVVDKAKIKAGSENSLLLPLEFLKYLQDVVFVKFNVEAGNVDMSRHTSCHGVAEPEQYTKDRALQFILILDQIYFYI